jgi:hypothetical protein
MLLTKIIVPLNIKICITNVKKKGGLFITLSNDLFNLNFYSKDKDLYINKFLNIIYLKGSYFLKDKVFLKGFISDFSNLFYKKIIFSGKGYKLETNKDKYYYFFNYSHLIMLKYKRVIYIKTKKNKFSLFLFKDQNLGLLNCIRKIRQLNKYTQKGIRYSRLAFFTKNKKKK